MLIVDTAGRLSIDERMMQEASDLSAFLKPIETFFVVDAMVGQDAINTAKVFNDRLPASSSRRWTVTPAAARRFLSAR